MLCSVLFFLVWCCRCAASFSAPQSQKIALASLEGEPTALVAGCVYALTGDYCETAVDLCIAGVEPLLFQRTFTSFWDAGTFFGGWSANTQCFLEKEGDYYAFTQEHGGKIYFSAQSHEVAPECFQAGLTNCANGEVGGKWDWKKARINPLNEGGEVTLGDSSRYQFNRRKLKIYKPNGSVIAYTDPFVKKRKVTLTGCDGEVKGWFRWDEESAEETVVEGSNGLKVRYLYKSAKDSSKLKIEAEHLPFIQYKRFEVKSPEPYGRIAKTLPEGRFLWVDHYRKGSYGMAPFEIKVHGEEDPLFGKVASLKEPAGETQEPVETYRFLYHPEKRMTEVFDAYQHLTRYYANENRRLMAIERYTGSKPYHLYSTERLFWGRYGRLRCRALLDGQGKPHLCIQYEYDKEGNVTTETIWGNLTGREDNPLQLSPQGIPSGGDNWKRHYTYSQDGFHLKLSEKNRKCHIFYTYQTGTERLSAKLISDKKKIRMRTFYTYDEQGAIAAEICDDGSGEQLSDLQGVSERHIVRYLNHSKTGLPLQQQEFYLDLKSNCEVLLKQTSWEYDAQGRKIREERFDGAAQKLYALTWEYDARGRLIKECNALGEVREYAYDENGNRVFEKGPDPELTIRFFYDCSNRLIRTEKKDRDGKVFTSSQTHYYTHQKYTATDWNGHTTCYRYDELGRLILIKHPPMLDQDGVEVDPIEKYSYDLQGYVCKKIDCEGNSTEISHTVHGKPFKIEYPDGSVERFTYTGNGDLVSSVGKGGEMRRIQRDFLGRPLLEEVVDSGGKVQSKKEYGYNAFHLLYEKGEDGIESHFRYDLAGRLIEKQIGERRILYSYNNLGQIVKEKDFYGSGDHDFVETTRRFDVLGRLLEERSDCFREVYKYDPRGNRIAVTTFLGDTPETVTRCYDALDRLIEERKGKEEKIRYFYERDQKITVDPAGSQTIETFGASGVLLQVEFYDPFKKLLVRQIWTHDRLGRKKTRVDETCLKNELKRSHTVSWEYDSLGRISAYVEGAGTSLQKKDTYNYDLSGRKSSWIKPDGTEITYAYDSLGNLLELKSSDHTLHDLYNYDRWHRLTKVEHLIQGTCSLSTWGRHGSLSHEKLANGKELHYAVDWHGRVTEVLLPDKSSIAYSYQGSRLKSVSRLSSKGELLYQHTYERWTNGGAPLSAQLAGENGKIKFQYHANGHLREVESDCWNEKALTYDPKGNLLSRSCNGLKENYRYNALSQLISEKGGIAQTYRYDPLGNRIAHEQQLQKINALNQVVQDGETYFTYDSCGRMILKEEKGERTSYHYDALDRLIEVEQGGEKTNYTYDHLHRRLSKSCGETTTHYLYQGQNEIGEMEENKWLNLRILGSGCGAEIGAAVAIELEEIPHVPIHTSTGSVALLLTLGGEIAETYFYTAYGEEKGVDYKNPWRFSSKRFDPETRFVFFGRRYYLPALGRWLTPDPLGEAGGTNLYAYVGCNPLSHIDLYGLMQERPSLFQKVGRMIGSVLKGIGDHVVPIPHLRDALSALGHRLKGGSRLNFKELCRNPHSALGCLPASKKEERTSLAYICGILNRLDDCIETADQISQAYGGVPVHFCYNSSEGFALDLVETTAQLMGVRTYAVEIAAHMLKERVRAVGADGKVLLHLHSQGGIIGYRALQQLTPAERKLIHVTTYGSAKLIPSKEVGSVTNLIARRDPVPWIADPLGSLHAYWTQKDPVQFIPSPRSPITSHLMSTYLNTLRSYP